MPEQLFIYGTLLPQFAPPHLLPLLKSLTAVGPATIRGILYDLGPFPGVVLGAEDESTVEGMVFRLPDDGGKTLAQIDEYEGFQPSGSGVSLFVREQVNIQFRGGAADSAWVYRYNRTLTGRARKIPAGDYQKWRVDQGWRPWTRTTTR